MKLKPYIFVHALSLEWIHLSRWLLLVCVCLHCVLFALPEVRRHAWSALLCLTVVFSRCHWLGVLWHGDGIMCSGPNRVEKRAGLQVPLAMPLPPPQTPYCEKSLGWALWALWSHCFAKCWPGWKAQCPWAWLILSTFSQALSRKPLEQEWKMLNYTHATKT